MLNVKTINDERLIFAAGGNDGDTQKEKENNYCMYKVGDSVEIYTTFLHIFTRHATIIEVFDSQSSVMPRAYKVKFDDGVTRWATADEIER